MKEPALVVNAALGPAFYGWGYLHLGDNYTIYLLPLILVHTRRDKYLVLNDVTSIGVIFRLTDLEFGNALRITL